MNELFFALSVGIIASLLSVLASLLFREVWLKIIIPWYKEKLYKGADIEGTWHSIMEYHNGEYNENIFVIHRKGNRIWGTVSSIDGAEKGEQWNFEGQFKYLIVTAIYESTNKKILDKGSMSLMLINNGKKFEGYLIYYSSHGNKMKSIPITLHQGLLKYNTDSRNKRSLKT